MAVTALVLLFGLALPSEPPARAPALVPPAQVVVVTDVAQGRSDAAALPARTPRVDVGPPGTKGSTGFKSLFRDLIGDVKALPSRPNLYVSLGGAAGALAVHPLDDTFNQRLAGHSRVFAAGKVVGQTPVQMGIAVGTYAYGRISSSDKVTHVGMDLVRAQILTAGLTGGLKVATRRERPDHSSHRSFPSGHASATFAAATVVARHFGWKMTAVSYTAAAYVGSSRLADNKHWLSDVAFGAAVGAVGGRTVTRHGRDVWTLSPAVVPGGAALLVSRSAP